MMPVVEVHDALRADPFNREIAQVSAGAPQSVAIDTPAVQGPAQAADPVAPFRIAGDEYLVINGAAFLDDSTTATAALRIDLSVDGDQVEGPRLAVVGAATSPSPTAEESTPLTTDDESAPADGDSGGLLAWPVVAGLLVLIVVVVVVAALALAKRRRR